MGPVAGRCSKQLVDARAICFSSRVMHCISSMYASIRAHLASTTLQCMHTSCMVVMYSCKYVCMSVCPVHSFIHSFAHSIILWYSFKSSKCDPTSPANGMQPRARKGCTYCFWNPLVTPITSLRTPPLSITEPGIRLYRITAASGLFTTLHVNPLGLTDVMIVHDWQAAVSFCISCALCITWYTHCCTQLKPSFFKWLVSKKIETKSNWRMKCFLKRNILRKNTNNWLMEPSPKCCVICAIISRLNIQVQTSNTPRKN